MVIHRHVTGSWVHVIDDGIVDEDSLPDEALPTGHVEFVPLGPAVAVAGQPATAYTVAPTNALVVEGVLHDLQGREGVWLTGEIGGQTIRWQATVRLQWREQEIAEWVISFDLDGDLRLSAKRPDDGVGLPALVVSRAESAARQAESAADRAEAAADDVDDAIAGAADDVVAAVEADRVAAEQAAAAASSSAAAADVSAGDASAAASAAASSAQDAAGSVSDAAGSAQDASSSASAAEGSASDAAQSATAAAGSASTASDAAQVIENNLPAINAAPGAAQAAVDARDVAEGHASDAAGSASAAAQSATDADSHRAAAAGSETAAGQSATDADQHRQAAEGHATDAEGFRDESRDARDAAVQARSGAEDERVVAQDAAALAEGHAQAADGHRVDAEAAAALAQSLRWVVRGAWSPGQYEAGDVVVWEERAYYAQTATSVEPPAQPWIPLTPAGGGGASHWDDLDGKPSVFPPEAHGHDAADITGEATPLLDVTEATVIGHVEGFGTVNMPVFGVAEFGIFAFLGLDSKANIGHDHDDRYVGLAGDDTKTGNLDMDGGSVTFVRPDITGGFARGLRWADRNGSLIGGIGAYGGPSGLHYFYFGHGDQPWEDPIIEGRPDRVEINGDLTVSGTVSGVGTEDVDGLQAALDGKADLGHTHPVTGLDTTGTPSASTVLYGDGRWDEPPAGGGASNDVPIIDAGSGEVVRIPQVVGTAAQVEAYLIAEYGTINAPVIAIIMPGG